MFTTVRSYIYQGNNINSLGWGFNCPTDDFISECDTLDPRFKVNVAKKGDSIQAKEGAGRSARIVWVPMEFHMSPKGYSNRKHEAGVAEYWGLRTNYNESPMNIRIFRYSNIYLMAAEAYIQKRDNAILYAGIWLLKNPTKFILDRVSIFTKNHQRTIFSLFQQVKLL